MRVYRVDCSALMNVTRDEGGNSTGAFTVIGTWKRHSTVGILGVNRGEKHSLWDRHAGMWQRRRVEDKQDELRGNAE